MQIQLYVSVFLYDKEILLEVNEKYLSAQLFGVRIGKRKCVKLQKKMWLLIAQVSVNSKECPIYCFNCGHCKKKKFL